MTKIEKLTELASRLSDDQLEGLIYHVEILLDGPFLDRAPPEVRASVQRGLEDIEAGRVLDAKDVFDRLEERIKGYR